MFFLDSEHVGIGNAPSKIDVSIKWAEGAEWKQVQVGGNFPQSS